MKALRAVVYGAWGIVMAIVVAMVLSGVLEKPPAPKPRIVQAVAFAACGDPAGILLIASDGTTAWFRPPYDGLAEAARGIPEGAQYSVDHCPPAL